MLIDPFLHIVGEPYFAASQFGDRFGEVRAADDLVGLLPADRPKSAAAISAKYATLIAFESEATSIKAFGPLIVPGLLQTEEYARALLQNGQPRLGPDEIETRIEARKGRQAIFDTDHPPRGQFIIDEAVLRRRVGGDVVMRAQLRHLAQVSARPDIGLQVIPFSAGAHAGTLGPLVILGFADGEDVVYCETYAGDLYPETVAWYSDVFDRLARDALSKTKSAELLKAAAEELR